MSPSADYPCSDCSAFLNWDEEEIETDSEKGVVFRSLVATVKLQSAFDDSLKAKAVKFLRYVTPWNPKSVSVLLGSFGRTTTESLTTFVQCIGMLVSSPSKIITTTAMKIVRHLILYCHSKILHPLVKADLIPQLITSLNPLSLHFPETVDIHTSLIYTIDNCFTLATPQGLKELEIDDENEQQAVHETVLQQVVAPSEQYIRQLCVNRRSIVDGGLSENFLSLFVGLLRICPYYQRTLEFILHLPIFLTIPSCLTFIGNDLSVWAFLMRMSFTQQRWNEKGGKGRQIWKTVDRMLRMEGFKDVIEEKLLNDKTEDSGRWIVTNSIAWNNQLGMNLPEQE
ncbi:hypothetical protein BLNAU_5100 [Blattamonas nauphoetae]|uniref:Uncharacterized protein n=1 Tax=Blattamonas nauphoetae TaxID=2049346 RepID=A0ABQ9Y882_9EUKA|nr:hypothetical protein BLNAU_5100 [Blattamonas nauphoetae]